MRPHVASQSDAICIQGVTRIKYCTDGVLLREMMEDPLLSAYRQVLYIPSHVALILVPVPLSCLASIPPPTSFSFLL